MSGQGLKDPLLSWVRALYARVVLGKGADEGATATEYAILVAFIAVIIIAGVAFFGQNLNGWFHRVGQAVEPFTS